MTARRSGSQASKTSWRAYASKTRGDATVGGTREPRATQPARAAATAPGPPPRRSAFVAASLPTTSAPWQTKSSLSRRKSLPRRTWAQNSSYARATGSRSTKTRRASGRSARISRRAPGRTPSSGDASKVTCDDRRCAFDSANDGCIA